MSERKVNIELKAKDHASQEVAKVKGEMSEMEPAGAQGAAGTDKLTTSLKAMAAAAAAAMSIAALVAIAKDSVGKFAEQEAAVNQLNVAVANNANMTAGASDRLQEYAAELQEVTTFGDEATIAAMLYLSTLGLTEEATKKVIVAAQDYAAATGKDLLQATMDVGKAAQGELGPMKDYGLTLAEGATQGENLANVLGQVNSKFGGQAAAQAETFGGKMKSLENIFGDLQEQLGGVISEGLGPLLDQLPSLVETAQPLIRAVGKIAAVAGKLLAPALRLISPLLEAAGILIEMAVDRLDPLIDLVVMLVEVLQPVADIIKEVTEEMQKWQNGILAWLGLAEEEEEATKEVEQAVRAQTTAIDELGEAEKALADEKRARLEEDKRIIAANKELLEIYESLVKTGRGVRAPGTELTEALSILTALEQVKIEAGAAGDVEGLGMGDLEEELARVAAAKAEALKKFEEEAKWASMEGQEFVETEELKEQLEKYEDALRMEEAIREEMKKRAEEEKKALDGHTRLEDRAAQERERHIKQITSEMEKQNEEIAKQQEQYALLDDLAQKQVKWLLEQARAGNMSAEEFGRLPDDAKKLIAQFPALRKEYGKLLGEIGAAAGLGGNIERPPAAREPLPLQVGFDPLKFENKIIVDDSDSVAEKFGQQALGVVTKMSEEIARQVYEKLVRALEGGELAGELERRLAS